jgi:hypothetical protein
MRRRRTVTGMAIAVALVAVCETPRTARAQAADLPRWIAGCWTGERGGERFTERWTVADDATLLGIAHTLKGGRLSAFEFLRIVVRGDTLVYIAQPGGAPPTEFAAPLSEQSASAITFANAKHDFPKRVGYQQNAPNGLTAWIDGGAARGPRIEYAMSRTACEP